jgi:hypothetical protein
VPLATLAVVLVVFVLVQVFTSWSAAGRAETTEATATLLLFREGELLQGTAVRQTVRREIVCYATSVVDQDWPAMADRDISNVPTYWAARFRDAGVRQARDGPRESAGEDFVTRDGERAAGRQDRLGEARRLRGDAAPHPRPRPALRGPDGPRPDRDDLRPQLRPATSPLR